MSQYPYPSPYTPPPPPDFMQYQPADLLAPSRRAGVLMFVIGGMMALYGLCNGVSSWTVSPEQLRQQMDLFGAAQPQGPQLSPEQMRVFGVIGGVTVLVLGVVFASLGAFVRRGSPGAVLASLIVSGLVGLVLLLFVLVFLAGMVMAPVFGVFACVMVVPLGMIILLLVWLGQAMKSAAQVTAVRQQFQSQFWQHQQNQMAFAPGGYLPPAGYGQAGYGPVGYGGTGYGQPPAPPSGSSSPAAPAPPPALPPTGPARSAAENGREPPTQD